LDGHGRSRMGVYGGSRTLAKFDHASGSLQPYSPKLSSGTLQKTNKMTHYGLCLNVVKSNFLVTVPLCHTVPRKLGSLKFGW